MIPLSSISEEKSQIIHLDQTKKFDILNETQDKKVKVEKTQKLKSDRIFKAKIEVYLVKARAFLSAMTWETIFF